MKKLLLSIGISAVAAISAYADAPASFPGGESALDKYITTNMKYPSTAAENGIEGVVNVRFTVNTDGSIGAIEIVRMIDPDLEQEAIRLIKGMPAWTPADKNGSPVQSIVTLPVTFSLE